MYVTRGSKPNCRKRKRAVPADRDAVTINGFLGGRIELVQPARGHRAGLDAALLQAMIPNDAAGRLVDIGTGTGVVALSAACRAPNLKATGIDIDPELIAMAARSLELAKNEAFSDRVNFLVADASLSRPERESAGLSDNMAEWVTMNPPYELSGQVRQSPDDKKRQAHVGDSATLEDWVRAASGLLKSGGRLALIHRADKLADLLVGLSVRFGAITIVPVHPRKDEPATRALLSGTKGSRSPLKLLRGIVLHDDGGEWTPFAEEILSGQRSLA